MWDFRHEAALFFRIVGALCLHPHLACKSKCEKHTLDSLVGFKRLVGLIWWLIG